MPVNEIRFMRLHITEEAARNAALNDFEAFKKEFPEAIIPRPETKYPLADVRYGENREYSEVILRERYAEHSVIACILNATIDTAKAPGVGGWLNRLFNAKMIESNPLR